MAIDLKEQVEKYMSPELLEKAREVTNTDELMTLVQNEGVDLTDEQLAAISGGDASSWGNYFACRANTSYCV